MKKRIRNKRAARLALLNKASLPQLGYLATYDDENLDNSVQVVVYGSSKLDAKRDAVSQLGLSHVGMVSAIRRAPEYDQYHLAGGPSVETLVRKHNWRWECQACGCSVEADTEDAQFEDGVWCSTECMVIDREQAERYRLAQAEHRALAAAKWPGAQVMWSTDKMVALRIPGAEGIATWDYTGETLVVQRKDYNVWMAYKVSLGMRVQHELADGPIPMA